MRPFKFTAESKSRLGYELLAAVNGGRLRCTPPTARRSTPSSGGRSSWRASAYRPSQQMNFYVDASEGHDDYLVSLALAVEAASERIDCAPHCARAGAGSLN